MILITPLPDVPAVKLPNISDAVQQTQLLVHQINTLQNDVTSISTDPDPALLVIKNAVSSMLEQARTLSSSLQVLQNCRDENTTIY